MEASVDFCLPVDFAGKIIKMSRRNANRIMSEHWANQRAENDTIKFMPEDQRERMFLEKSVMYKQAELDALMAVTQAREQGQIKKRNILKMDLKINTQIAKYISDTQPKLKSTMPEQVKYYSSNQK